MEESISIPPFDPQYTSHEKDLTADPECPFPVGVEYYRPPVPVKKENAILHRSLKSRRKRAKFNFADKVFYAIVKMLRQHTTDKPRPTPHTTTRVHSRTSFFVADNGNRNEHPHANTSNKNSPPHPTHANTKTTTHNETTDTTNEE